MGGRRRELSHSPVEPAAIGRQTRPQSELSVFSPIPSNSDDFDQSQIIINDAVIYDKTGTAIKNPLHIQLDGPLLMRGWAQPPENDAENKVKGKF